LVYKRALIDLGTVEVQFLGQARLESSLADSEISKETAKIVIKAYKQMLTALFVSTLLVLAIGFSLIYPFLRDYFIFHNKANPSDPPLIAIVMVTGALGAFFSALTRLYSFDALPKILQDNELNLPQMQMIMYSLIPAVIGAIAALVLYLAFAGDLISGQLFPKIQCNESSCQTFGSLLSTDGPADAQNFAKVMVWSFVAGFAERLVPSTLNALSKAVEAKK
jgi:hypothetical protein